MKRDYNSASGSMLFSWREPERDTQIVCSEPRKVGSSIYRDQFSHDDASTATHPCVSIFVFPSHTFVQLSPSSRHIAVCIAIQGRYSATTRSSSIAIPIPRRGRLTDKKDPKRYMRRANCRTLSLYMYVYIRTCVYINALGVPVSICQC